MASAPTDRERIPIADKEGRINRYPLQPSKSAIVPTSEASFEATEHGERREGVHGFYARARDRILSTCSGICGLIRKQSSIFRARRRLRTLILRGGPRRKRFLV